MACQDRKAAALPTASAAGAGRRPAYPCAGLSARARTPSQAPLGWGRVPPCTGPWKAGLPKLTFKTALIALLLLLASLPRKGIDKEAGRSARAPAPEVALLLPAQAQSGAPLRARGATRRHPHSTCLPRPRLRLYTPARPPSHPQTPSPHAHAERAPHATGKGGSRKRALSPRKRGRLAAKGQGRKVKGVRGTPLTLPQGLHKPCQILGLLWREAPAPLNS